MQFVDIDLSNIDMQDLPIPRVRTAGILDHNPSWDWDMDGGGGEQFVFWIVTGGDGELRAGPDTIELHRGVCVVSPLSEPHHGRQSATELLRIPWVVFEYTDPTTGTALQPAQRPRRQRLVDTVDLLSVLVERAVDAHLGGPARWEEASAWMQAALLEVARIDRQPLPHGVDRGIFERIDELGQKIRRAPGAPYTLDSLAESVHYTPDHLVRLFRKYKGVTPMEYVIRCRMEAAQQMLLFSGLPVARVAEAAGYNDLSHFSRQFSLRSGMSPTAFRRRAGVQ
jgi:AraC-like DNA-binding protein